MQMSVKNDSGRYVCFSNAGGKVNKNDVHLEVIDVSYIPEIDDWQVVSLFLSIMNYWLIGTNYLDAIKSNLMRGVIAAVVTCLFLLSSCTVHHFRWNDKHHKKEINARANKSHSGDPVELGDCSRKGNAGSINQTFVVDEDDVAQTTM